MNNAIFYDGLRKGLLGPVLSPSELTGVRTILEASTGLQISQTAYLLATAYHETAHTMQPIDEIGSSAYFFRMYDIHGNRPSVARELGNLSPGDGIAFHGRGYVQLTGRRNYEWAARMTGQPLLNQPELAKSPPVAATILRKGCEFGKFTGKRLSDYLTQPKEIFAHFKEARRIINGTDRADLIAGYALLFQEELEKAGAP